MNPFSLITSHLHRQCASAIFCKLWHILYNLAPGLQPCRPVSIKSYGKKKVESKVIWNFLSPSCALLVLWHRYLPSMLFLSLRNAIRATVMTPINFYTFLKRCVGNGSFWRGSEFPTFNGRLADLDYATVWSE